VRRPPITVIREYEPSVERQVQALLSLLAHPAAPEPVQADAPQAPEPVAAREARG
jgi:hypothetical protein